jgi:hypothetical protein
MFSQNTETVEEQPIPAPAPPSKFKNMIQPPSVSYGETNYAEIEEMLEQEHQKNKAEAWPTFGPRPRKSLIIKRWLERESNPRHIRICSWLFHAS